MALIASFMHRAPARTAVKTLQTRTMAALVTQGSSIASRTDSFVKQSILTPQGTAVRHAGASALACGIAVVGLGGVAQGVGTVFAALVVGTARNPAIKDDLFAYTMIGFGMVELIMMIVIIFAGMLLTSE